MKLGWPLCNIYLGKMNISMTTVLEQIRAQWRTSLEYFGAQNADFYSKILYKPIMLKIKLTSTYALGAHIFRNEVFQKWNW